MPLLDDIEDEVQAVFRTIWKTRDGIVVPEAEHVRLGNDAVLLRGTVLYADLAASTDLVTRYKDQFAAEVYKAYLLSSCRIIRSQDGVITAFDGDRVMAVFLGDSQNSAAAKAALMINYVVHNTINALMKTQYPDTGYEVQQAVGIDTGDLLVARTGIRGANDLVWVGRAANYAAKLCSLREGTYASYITQDVFDALSEQSKYGGSPTQCMWEKVIWDTYGIPVYRSSWWWKP